MSLLRRHPWVRVCSLWLVVLLVNGCASRGDGPANEIADPSLNIHSEQAIGQKIHQEILSTFRPYTEPHVLEYVDRVGHNIAAKADRKELKYQFMILYNDRIYAASAPGGYVYLTTGMIWFLENESELAAVLAHEIGELQYKDPQLSRSRQVLNTVLDSGAMVAPAFGQFGALAALGLAMARNAAEKRAQNAVPEAPEDKVVIADGKAMEYMFKAGYDPQGLIDLQYRLLNARDEVVPYFRDYYQSRPITMDRMKNLDKFFEKLPMQNKSFSTNRESYLEMTKGIREIYKG